MALGTARVDIGATFDATAPANTLLYGNFLSTIQPAVVHGAPQDVYARLVNWIWVGHSHEHEIASGGVIPNAAAHQSAMVRRSLAAI